MSNTFSKDSAKKINLMSGVTQELISYRRSVQEGMETLEQMSEKVKMRGIDQVYNGVAEIMIDMEDYISDNAATAFIGMAEGMSGKNAIVRGAEFKRRLDGLIEELPALLKKNEYKIRELSSGLDEELDQANITAFVEAIRDILQARYKMVTVVADLVQANRIEDDTRIMFDRVIGDIGEKSNVLSSYLVKDARDTINVLTGGVSIETEELDSTSSRVKAGVVKGKAIDIYGDDF